MLAVTLDSCSLRVKARSRNETEGKGITEQNRDVASCALLK